MKLLIVLIIHFFGNYYAAADSTTFIEKEQEAVDYSNIRNVLKNDGLNQEIEKKKVLIKKIKAKRKKISKEKYNFPSEKDMLGIISELWLVENAQELKWDFPKPEYGIQEAFKALLEKIGFYNLHFKILILNSPNVVHFALPGKDDQVLFLLSLPFMRNLDLTKVDISLLLLEDLLRLQAGYFKENLELDEKLIGQNFYGEKLLPDFWKKYTKAYDKVIRKTGFNFQQQFEITKKMDGLLKSTPALWNAYFKLINKLDKFLKVDVLFKHMIKIYPSPELQLKWLAPPKKQL